MDLFRQLFALPPIEKRYAPFWFLRFLLGENAVRKRSDDTYLYYSIFRTSFYVSLVLALLNVASHTFGTAFDFYFFAIDLTGADYVTTYLMTFTKYTPTILIFFVLPYYVVLFRLHINPRTFDLSWWHRGQSPLETMARWRLWALLIANCLIVPVAMYGLFGIFMLFVDGHPHLAHSYPFFLLCVGLTPFLLAWATFAFLIVIMYFWRYSGKHSG